MRLDKRKRDSGTRYLCHVFWLFLAVMLGTIFLFGTAGAEGVPLERGLTLRRVVPQRTRGLPYLGSTDAVTCERVEWTLSTEAAATGVKYMYSIGILDGTNPDEEGQPVADTLYQGPITTETTFGYTFYEEGTYVLFVDPCDQYGRMTMNVSLYYMVYVSEGTEENPLMSEVLRVAGLCRKGSDFATALAINDWLCENVSYDRSCTYFSPEGALLHGKGVCNAYTRAFQLIAAECGLQVYRACGMAGKNWHTWNTVRMDGNWYHVDVTWNDNGSPPGYYWFGITDDLIAVDHQFLYFAQGDSCECVHMECNYYVHENKLEDYTIAVEDDDEAYQTIPGIIQKVFDTGSVLYNEDVSSFYPFYDRDLETIDMDWPLLRAVLEAGLPKHEFTLMGESVQIAVHTTDNERLIVEITECSISESKALVMPRDLTAIGAGAFEKTNATKVIINDECIEIGSRAFADSRVRMIRIPGSVTEIAGDAFDGCGQIVVIAEAGTQAAVFADEKGLIRVKPGF